MGNHCRNIVVERVTGVQAYREYSHLADSDSRLTERAEPLSASHSASIVSPAQNTRATAKRDRLLYCATEKAPWLGDFLKFPELTAHGIAISCHHTLETPAPGLRGDHLPWGLPW